MGASKPAVRSVEFEVTFDPDGAFVTWHVHVHGPSEYTVRRRGGRRLDIRRSDLAGRSVQDVLALVCTELAL